MDKTFKYKFRHDIIRYTDSNNIEMYVSTIKQSWALFEFDNRI